MPAGSVYRSIKTELAAMLAAFTFLLSLPDESRSLILTVLCALTSSLASSLQRGPDAQHLSLTERV